MARRGVTILLATWPCYPPTENIIMAILKSFVLLFSPISGELQPDIGLFTSDANTGKN